MNAFRQKRDSGTFMIIGKGTRAQGLFQLDLRIYGLLVSFGGIRIIFNPCVSSRVARKFGRVGTQ